MPGFTPANLAALQGDAFGIVNSLFAALAFLGIIATILLQSRELELQREELRLTREEITKTVEAQQSTAESQERSADALSRQAESLFQAAYLNALTSLRESQQSTKEPATQFGITPHASITSKLELIVSGFASTFAASNEALKWRAEQLSIIEEISRHNQNLRQHLSCSTNDFQAARRAFSAAVRLRSYLEDLNDRFDPEAWSHLELFTLWTVREWIAKELSEEPSTSNDIFKLLDVINRCVDDISEWLATISLSG